MKKRPLIITNKFANNAAVSQLISTINLHISKIGPQQMPDATSDRYIIGPETNALTPRQPVSQSLSLPVTPVL